MSRLQDRLTLLSAFVRIAERGSISAAARDLGISQASASRQLQDLEARVGAQLVRRTTHSLALTESGESCLSDARALIDGWEALVERRQIENDQITGSLRVVAPVALGQTHLADAVVQFQQAHPRMSVDWRLDDAPVRFAEIGCDLWIRIGRVPDDRLVVRPAGRVQRMVVARADLVEQRRLDSPERLADAPCVALSPFEGDAIPLTNDQGETLTVRARPTMSTNNIVAAKTAVLRGVGYAVMPRWFVDAELEDGRLVDAAPGWRAPALAVNVAYLPGARQPRRLSVFIDHILDWIERIPGVTAP